MKTPSFLLCVGLALTVSVAGAVLFRVAQTSLGVDTALRLVIALAAASYGLFQLQIVRHRAGLVITSLLWGLVSALVWYSEVPLWSYTLVHIGMLFVLRCLLFHSGLVSVLMDLGLQIAGLMAALWALQQSHSLLLCLWSFFLTQCLLVVPGQLDTVPQSDFESGFQRAHRSAQAALRRLSLPHL